MKNPLLTCFMLLLCVCSFAQTGRGSFKIAGGASYSRSDDKREYRNGGNETSSTSLRFQPSIGYFVIDKLAIGASVSLSRTTMRFDEQSVYADERSISTSSSIGPSIQYYIPLGKSFYIVPTTWITWGRSRSDSFYFDGYDVTEYETTGRIRNLGVGAGLSYFVNQHVSIDLGLNYTYLRTVYEYEFGDEETLTNSGVNLAFGLSIFLTRDKTGE